MSFSGEMTCDGTKIGVTRGIIQVSEAGRFGQIQSIAKYNRRGKVRQVDKYCK